MSPMNGLKLLNEDGTYIHMRIVNKWNLRIYTVWVKLMIKQSSTIFSNSIKIAALIFF